MLRSMQALLVHEQNEQRAMQRAAQAQAQGLDPATYGTVFPGSTVNTTNTTTNNTGGGLVKGMILAATLATAAAGGGVGVGRMLTAPPAPAPAAPAAAQAEAPAKVVTVPGRDQQYDAIYEVRQPDGTWRQVKRERLRPGEGAP